MMKRMRITEEQIIGVLKELEGENAKLKRPLVDVMLDKAAA